MSVNEKIAAAAWAALFGDFYAYQDRDGMCLAFVRRVIEKALGRPDRWLYEHAVTEWVQPEGYDRRLGHWARDAERSLRNLGMTLVGDRPKPGDLLFNYEAAPSPYGEGHNYGHVGILVDRGMVIENVDPAYRPFSLPKGAICLTPRRVRWPATTIVRFDLEKVPE